MVELAIIVVLIALLLGHLRRAGSMRQRELQRLRDDHAGKDQSLEQRYYRFLERLGSSLAPAEIEDPEYRRNRELERKLREAGLATSSGRGKYLLIRLLCFACWPVIVYFAWVSFIPYYATVTTVFSLAFVIIGPYLWLKRKTIERKESIQRELPLFIDLTNLAASAGLDVTASLEKVVDALVPEFPDHAFVSELRRARWLTSQGYTWGEALDRISAKLNDEAVSRVTRSLKQAIEQGGDRSGQMAGIAEDAQRAYYAVLDKRLAQVPFKALMVTLVLFLTYFTVLLAPAAVGISSTMSLF
jgi:pilus assembly protein TadC